MRNRARAGKYDETVNVGVKTITVDTFGQEHTTWPATMLLYVKRDYEYRPTDFFAEASGTHHYEQKIWFYTRQDHQLNRETMRIQADDGDYEILAIESTGRNQEIRLLCRQVPR